MSTTSEPLVQSAVAVSAGVPLVPAAAERQMTDLHALLHELEAVSAAGHTQPPVFSEAVDEQLVQVRLGVAASLFAALQCKNAAVARHALRVALSCSAWAAKIELIDADRDALEIAALLHDIGVIGAPDNILLKPEAFDDDEAVVMAHARRMSVDILRRGCRSPEILEIVENVAAWYDGSRSGFSLRGEQIPRGARMIAIVEAFDAMTTDLVYRPARSKERAMGELYECAGTQFDPELVKQFAAFQQANQTATRWEAAHRWLRSLDPAMVNSYWELGNPPSPTAEPGVDLLFQGRLLDNMYDAVVFIDGTGHIALWNRGAERLTGVSGASVCGQPWQPTLLDLADEKGRSILESDCPVHTAIRCGAQSLRRLSIRGRGQRAIAVDTHAIPVIDAKGMTQGAVLLFHDASSEISLERQCQSLHEKATKDALTQVANRAEFDRVHAMFVTAHQQQQVPCSLMMCDMDHFKLVNDTYGHQAGDDAIKSLASLLKSACRPGDLVARYGGEEFVLLCTDCDNATAARRADQIRKSLSELTQAKMEGQTVTVSFGVTEIQPGDTPETMLRRADRALLTAKANGRNTVVQLGTGSGEEKAEEPPPTHRSFRPTWPKGDAIEQDLVTSVPVKIAIEKLRGFVADHRAKIVAVNGNQLLLEIDDKPLSRFRRLTDRATSFRMDLRFEEERVQTDRGGTPARGSGTTRTRVKVAIGPRTKRDRRRDNLQEKARDVLTSFRSYLMAAEEEPLSGSSPLKSAKRILMPWLTRK